MEKLAKINDVAAVTAADYETLYAEYEKAVNASNHWKDLYDYVDKQNVVIKERYDALANMVNNAADLVRLLEK